MPFQMLNGLQFIQAKHKFSSLIIQYGWVVANATGAFNVNFPIAFNETPRIFSQYVSGDYETNIACISITRKYTQAGFELYNTLSGSGIWHAWFAIGK